MGKIMAEKIKGMNLWAKISLVTTFTLLLSTFMYQGWYKPKQATAAISYVATSSAGAASGNLTISAPTGLAAGDVMIISVTDRGTTNTAPTMSSTGWTTLQSLDIHGTSATFRWAFSAYKVATAADVGATYTVTNGTGANIAANIYAFRGVDNTTPIDAQGGTATTAASVTLSAPTITTTAANDWIVFLGQVAETTSTNFSGWATANIPAASWTSIISTGTTNGSNGAAYATLAAAGATGAGTATITSYRNGGVLVALKPAAVATQTLDSFTDNSANSTVPVTDLTMATIASTATGGGAALTATSVTIGGTVALADVTNIKVFWGATQVASITPTTLTNQSITLTGAGSATGSLVYKISLAASAAGKTYALTVNSVTGSTGGVLTLPQTTATRTASAGVTQTLDSFTDNSTAASVPATDLTMATIASTATGGGAALTATSVTIGGTVALADVTNIKVFWGATQVASITPTTLTNQSITLTGAGSATGSLVYKISLASSAGGKTFNLTVNSVTGSTGGALTLPQTTATQNATAPVNLTTAGTATATQASGTSISVTMPYTNDANANNTYTVSYGPSSTGPWTAWVTAAAHTASPYATTITGLTTGNTYYVQCTYNDADTVTGTNPQVVGPITLSVWANSPLLHNSTNLSSTKWGANGWGIPGGKYGAFVCTTCHVRGTNNIKRIRGSITAPLGNWSTNSLPSVSASFNNVTSMGHDNRSPNTTSTNICEVCHSRNKYHNYNATRNALFGGVLTHNNGLDCTGCHPHNNAFKASESPGNLDCSSCHNDIYGQLNGSATTYHHYMQNAAVTTLGSGTKYPNSATPTTTDTNRRCLMCHVDHDIFRPDINVGNGQRGKNLRADATGTVSTTSGFARKDFDNSQTNGGICVSCHTNQQTKNTTNQKSDATTVTPIITKALYAGTMHNYTTNSSALTDGTKVNVNCIKCHDAQNAEGAPKTNFGTHDNTARRLFGALGGTLADPYEEQFCYRCHSKTTDAVGGTVKPAAGKDWYNAAAMTAAAEDTFTSFNAKTYGHKPSSYSGIHKPTSVDETFAYISANKHVECTDCHDPHAAKNTIHTAGTNTIAATSPLSNASGVATPIWPAIWTAPAQSAYGTAPGTATLEWQVCFQCHSGANSNVLTWGGAGAAAWTDLGLEFNPNNRSVHPVVTSLNNQAGELAPKPEIAAAMVAPWTAVGTQTMYCTDCHATDSTGGSKGPHGSAVKWMLAGTNKAWPYNNSTLNGTNGTTATTFILNTGTTSDPTATGGVFCLNCHAWAGAGQPHTDGNHTLSTLYCVSCHIRVPHGGKVSNLINTNTAGTVARYSPTGDGNAAVPVYLNAYVKPATRGSYSQTNCYSTNSTCSFHNANNSGETW